jgi:hypothetical protein
MKLVLLKTCKTPAKTGKVQERALQWSFEEKPDSNPENQDHYREG